MSERRRLTIINYAFGILVVGLALLDYSSLLDVKTFIEVHAGIAVGAIETLHVCQQ